METPATQDALRRRGGHHLGAALAGVGVVCALLRGLGIATAAMPGRDAGTYAWMARGAADGELARLFDTVFHPLHAALAALLLGVLPATGTGDTEVLALQLVAGLGDVAAALLVVLLADRVTGSLRVAVAAGLLCAVDSASTRHAVDGLTEGLHHALLAAWALATLHARIGGARWALAGAATAALAWFNRPEGAALLVLGPLWLAWVGARRSATLQLLGGVGLAAMLPIAWRATGHGWAVSPKAGFVWRDGVGGEGAGIAHYLEHLVRMPLALCEGLGLLFVPLAVVGVWRVVRRRDRVEEHTRRSMVLLLAPLLVQCLVVPALRSHPRFFSGPLPLVAPWAGLGLVVVLDRLAATARRPRLACGLACLLVFGLELARLPLHHNEHRADLRSLGQHFAGQIEDGTLLTDLPRFALFAALRPGPPRARPPAELLQAAARPRVRWVVLAPARAGVEPAALRSLGYREIDLPETLRAAAERQGVMVLRR